MKSAKMTEKIRERLNFYLDLIRARKEIKNLYLSLSEPAKKDFLMMLRFNLARTVKPYSLSKNESQKFNFYDVNDKVFIYDDFIFRSARIKPGTANSDQSIRDPSVMINEIMAIQVYEEGRVRIGPEDTVLDCGANIGIFSVYAAAKAKKVYAFEPSRTEIISLKENIGLNRCDKIKIITKAVWNKNKKAKLKMLGTTSHFLTEENGRQDEGADIETVTIDDFVDRENLTRVDFIKMDIEGSERKALLGAKKTLKKFKPKLAICLYHKYCDFYKIPLLIRKLNPDYKLEIKNKGNIPMLYSF